MSTKPASPDLKIREGDLEPLLNRLESNTLTDDDKRLLKEIFYLFIWLQEKYDAGHCMEQ